jgi:alpha/beta superfamily hydrolase
MPDGIILAADVFRPAGRAPAPVIMSMGPYGKGIHFRDSHRPAWDQLTAGHPEILHASSGEHMVWEVVDPGQWVPDGYAVVRVDSRGAGRSGGYLDCFSPQETSDFYQAIEWAAAQPWSSGKVGLCGISYYAMSQWLVAALQPPHLAAIIIWEGAQDFYRDVTHHGGILSNVFPDFWYVGSVVRNQHGQGPRGLPDRGAGGLAAGPQTLPEEQLAAQRADLPADIRTHASDDGYYHARTADLSRVTVPLLSAANWAGFGLHARGNFSGYSHAPPRRNGWKSTAAATRNGSTCPQASNYSTGSSTTSSRASATAGRQSRRSGSTSAAPASTSSCAARPSGRWPGPAGPSCTWTPQPPGWRRNPRPRRPRSPSTRSARVSPSAPPWKPRPRSPARWRPPSRSPPPPPTPTSSPPCRHSSPTAARSSSRAPARLRRPWPRAGSACPTGAPTPPALAPTSPSTPTTRPSPPTPDSPMK